MTGFVTRYQWCGGCAMRCRIALCTGMSERQLKLWLAFADAHRGHAGHGSGEVDDPARAEWRTDLVAGADAPAARARVDVRRLTDVAAQGELFVFVDQGGPTDAT